MKTSLLRRMSWHRLAANSGACYCRAVGPHQTAPTGSFLQACVLGISRRVWILVFMCSTVLC